MTKIPVPDEAQARAIRPKLRKTGRRGYREISDRPDNTQSLTRRPRQPAEIELRTFVWLALGTVASSAAITLQKLAATRS